MRCSPNNDGGGGKSEIRAEPPIGAKVTLQLVEKFGAARMKWVLECIFDDLLDFNVSTEAICRCLRWLDVLLIYCFW